MPDDGPTHSPTDSRADQNPPPESSRGEPSGPDALAEALRHLAEAREYFIHLAVAEIERVKLRLRRAAMWAVVGLTALVLLLAILVAATGLLLFGVAQWVGDLFGGRVGLGFVVTGGGILLLGAAAVGWGLWAWQASSFDAAKERFAARRRRQQGQFGHSVDSANDDQEEHQSGSDSTKKND